MLLAALLVASSLVLVKTAHDARSAFTAIEREKAEARRLDIEWKRLEAERQAQATHLRVEKVARDKLGMRGAGAGVTLYVSDARAASSPATAAGASR
jgi:cell division protein FtsL